MTHDKAKHRPGWLLVELLLLLTLISFVMMAGLSLTATVKSTQRAVFADVANGQTLHRLANEFRRDLQRATSVELLNDAARHGVVIVELTKDRIEYTADQGAIRRTARAEDGTLARDLFSFQGATQVEWSVMKGTDAGPLSSVPRARMALTLPRPGSHPRLFRHFEIEGIAPLASTQEGPPDG